MISCWARTVDTPASSRRRPGCERHRSPGAGRLCPGLAPEGKTAGRARSAVGHLLRSLRPVAALLRPYRRLVAAAVVVHVLIQAATVGPVMAGALIVGRAISGASAARLVPLTWLIVAIVVPLGALGFLDMYVTHVMSFRILHEPRLVLYRRF
jgi:ABC-type bacteriocin/lantibiotic exporter with double-glycine peptidase domain